MNRLNQKSLQHFAILLFWAFFWCFIFFIFYMCFPRNRNMINWASIFPLFYMEKSNITTGISKYYYLKTCMLLCNYQMITNFYARDQPILQYDFVIGGKCHLDWTYEIYYQYIIYITPYPRIEQAFLSLSEKQSFRDSLL